MKKSQLKVSIIIPSLDGRRNGNISKLREQSKAQTFQDFEVCVVTGISPQGKAINMGAEKAQGEILVIMDDDSSLGNNNVFENLVEVIEKNEKIGMVGASVVSSPNANRFERLAAKQFPRFNVPIVGKITDSDMACHGCCAIPKRVFMEAGRERENIIRGLDPDLRFRLRKLGYRVVLAANTWIYHPMPDNFFKLVRTFFRNGKGSSYAQKFHPELVYETDESLIPVDFKPKVNFFLRCLRFPLRLLRALFSLKLLRLTAYTSYALGFIWGYCNSSATVLTLRN